MPWLRLYSKSPTHRAGRTQDTESKLSLQHPGADAPLLSAEQKMNNFNSYDSKTQSDTVETRIDISHFLNIYYVRGTYMYAVLFKLYKSPWSGSAIIFSIL